LRQRPVEPPGSRQQLEYLSCVGAVPAFALFELAEMSGCPTLEFGSELPMRDIKEGPGEMRQVPGKASDPA